MKSLVRVSFGALVVASLFAFAGCSDDDGGDDGAGGASGQGEGGAAAGALKCQVIGELCHQADAASGTAHDCHETGHEGKVAACAAAFDGCVSACVVDEGGAPATKQDAHCAAIGELCHEVDDGDGPLHDCHEVGHVGHAAKCVEVFGECATRCLAARKLLEAGQGGAGGTGSGAGGPASSHGGEASNSGGMMSAGGAAAGAAGG